MVAVWNRAGHYIFALWLLSSYSIFFGRPFVKRFALCYRSVVCLSCLPVCNVGVLWPNGWTDQDETWRAGRPRPWPHCVNNNNNNNNQRQCLWCCHRDHGYCESSPGSFDECRLSAGWPPTHRPSQPTWAVSPPIHAATIHIHHRHLLLLLSPKADTHFTVPRRVEG